MQTVRLILLTVILSMLASCANLKLAKIEPEPPRIDCSERAAPEPLPALPRWPALPALSAGYGDWQRYLKKLNATWGAHLVRTYGAYESVVEQRVETADCLDRDRAAGRIR